MSENKNISTCDHATALAVASVELGYESACASIGIEPRRVLRQELYASHRDAHWALINALVPIAVEVAQCDDWDVALCRSLVQLTRRIESGKVDVNEPGSIARMAAVGACEETRGRASYPAGLLVNAAALAKDAAHDGSGILPLLVEAAEALVACSDDAIGTAHRIARVMGDGGKPARRSQKAA